MNTLSRFLIWSRPAEAVLKDGRVYVRVEDGKEMLPALALRLRMVPGDAIALTYAGHISGDVSRLVLARNHTSGEEHVFDGHVNILARAYLAVRWMAFIIGCMAAALVTPLALSLAGPLAAALVGGTLIVGIFASVDALCRSGQRSVSRAVMAEAAALSKVAIDLKRRVSNRGGVRC